MKNQCEWHRIKGYGVPTFALVWVGVAICGCYWPCIWCWTWSHYESARWAVEKGTRSGYEQEQTDTAKMNWNLCLSLSHHLQLRFHSDLREKLALFAMELHLHLAQDSEKLLEDIWWELGACGLNVVSGWLTTSAGQWQCAPAATASASLPLSSGSKNMATPSLPSY